MRKEPIKTAEIYHVFNKSIAGFTIFNTNNEFLRMLSVIRYYQRKNPEMSFCRFFDPVEGGKDCIKDFTALRSKEKLVEIVSYCLMPTHFHLILKQVMDNGISTFISNVANSYSRYFNLKHKRKGPLWEGRFKSALVKTDEQLLHLTRYIHLNPVTAFLINEPEKWEVSSYNEYVSKVDEAKGICDYKDILNIEPASYKRFVEDRVSYQRELAEIKTLILE